MIWEYLVHTHEPHESIHWSERHKPPKFDSELTAWLNKHGKEGWELVTTHRDAASGTHSQYIFKRSAQSN
jgi:Domain of unknown function (DUF4177)